MGRNACYSLVEYEKLVYWSYKAGLSTFCYQAHEGKLRLGGSGRQFYAAVKLVVIHLSFVVAQWWYLKKTLDSKHAGIDQILHHAAWICGPLYALNPHLSFLIRGNDWCGTLDETMWTYGNIIGKLASGRYARNLRKGIRLAYLTVFQVWMGSVVGASLFYLNFPNNHVHAYSHVKAVLNRYIHPSLTFALGMAYETIHMYFDWAPLFLSNCFYFTMMAILSTSLRAIRYELLHGNLSVQHSIRLYRVVHLVVQRYNNSFAKAWALYVSQNTMQFWLMAYQLVRFGLRVPFMELMILWANVFYEILKIIVSKIGYDVYVVSGKLRQDMLDAVGREEGSNKRRACLRRMVWSSQPLALKYGTFCDQTPLANLALLHVTVSNLIVFLTL